MIQLSRRIFNHLLVLLVLTIASLVIAPLLTPPLIGGEHSGDEEQQKIAAQPAADGFQLEGFLNTYCVQCHGESKQKADRRFDQLKMDLSDAATGESLQEILDQLNLGDMPPQGEPQPSDKELAAAVNWLTASLKRARELARQNAGQIVMRRLNKQEYRNTVSDLFDLELDGFDITMGFPDDERADGFDNIGEALIMSGYRMEQVLWSAEKISERVIQHGPMPTAKTVVNAPPTDGRQPLGPNLLARFLIDRDSHDISSHTGRPWVTPANGEYVLKIDAAMMRRLKSRYDNDQLRYYKWREPARLRVVASANSDPPYYRVLGELEVPDDETKTLTLRANIQKNARITISWINGLHSSHKKIYRKVLPNYTEDAIYPERNPRQMYIGSGPELHISQTSVEGPLYETWPPKGFARYFHDVPKQPDLSDLKRCLDRLAAKAFRQPIGDDHPRAYFKVARTSFEEHGDFWDAARLGVRTILCSPRFLYLEESKAPAESNRSTSAYELASRLSYFLWRSMPDDALFAAAEDGSLLKDEALINQVERMLRDPKARRFESDFIDRWLWLDQLGKMPPDPQKDKAYYDLNLESAMRRETQALFHHVLSTNSDVCEFLNADYTFINKSLADFYGLERESDQPPEKFIRTSLTSDYRRGLLGHASILTVTSNGVETQPVRRGVWVLDNLLGTPTPPPPPDVPEIAPDTRAAKTIRQLMELHRADRTCFTCHKKIDPLGLSMENFDYLGRWRTRYDKAAAHNGGPEASQINAKVEIGNGDYIEGAVGLRQYLEKNTDQFRHCLAEKLMIFALGRQLSFTDNDDLQAIAKNKSKGLRDMIKAIVLSEPFRTK